MIRKIVENKFDSEKSYVELACLSTDSKPVGGMITGSLALEVDTKKIYAYNEDASSGEEWVEQVQLGGS